MRPSAQVRSTHSSRSAGPGPPSVPTDSDGAPRSCGSRRSAVRSGRNGTRTVLRGRHVTWTSTSASARSAQARSTSRVFPTPASPTTRSAPARPARASSTAARTLPTSRVRPMNPPLADVPDRCGHPRSVTARRRARHDASEGSGGPFSGVSPDVAQGRWAGPWRSQHTATSRENHMFQNQPQGRGRRSTGRHLLRVVAPAACALTLLGLTAGPSSARPDAGEPLTHTITATRASASSSGSVRSSPAATTTPGTGCRHLPGSPSGEPTRHPPGGPGPQWSGAVHRVLIVEVVTGQRPGGEPLLTGQLPHLPGGARADQCDDAAEHDVRPARAGPGRDEGHRHDRDVDRRRRCGPTGTPPRSASHRGAAPARAAGRTPCSPRPRRPR